MLEPPTHRHNEQIANLQAQLAALKQENIGLKSRLRFCEQPQATLLDAGSLHHLLEAPATSAVGPASATAANAVLKILLEAEQARSAELEKVNEALRRGVERLAATGDINALLDSFLLEAIAVTGASAGAVFDRVTGTEFQVRSLAQDGAIIRPSDTDAFGGALREVSARDPAGAFKQITEGQVYCHEVDSHYASWFPEAAAYHRQQGNQVTWNFPFRIGHEVAGFLGIAFREQRSPNLIMTETVQALSHQVSLALETLRLAEEAKQAALAREQEKAAQERAAELVKSNEALQQTIDAIGSLSDLDDFVPAVLTIVARTFGTTECGYYEHHEDETVYLRYWFSKGKVLNPMDLQLLDPAQHQVLRQLANGFTVPPEHLHGTTVRNRTRPVVLDHTRATSVPKLHAFAVSQGWDLELNQPLVVDGKADGALVIYRGANQPFSQAEIALAEALAKQLALAMQASRLSVQARDRAVEAAIAREQERAAQERAAELTKMNQALQAEVVEREWAERLARGQTETLVNTLSVLAADPVLDNFLGYMLQAIANQLGDSSGSIWLYDETQNTTVLHLNYEDGQIQQGSQIIRPGTDRQVLQQWDLDYMQTLREQKLLIQDLQQFADLPAYAAYHAHNQQRGIKTILIVALFFGDTFLGNITLRRTEYRDYKPEELALARVLAHQAALAIQLTRFADQGRQAAIIEERNRMAREIHDTIAQGLGGIVIQLQAAAAIDDRSAQQEHLTQARQLAEFSLTEARRSVQALRPHQLEATNLADALTTLAQHRTQNTDAHSICDVCGSPYPLQPDVEGHLFRIAQEALTNAVKHAHASEVHLTLVYQPTQVQLIVHDNGQGFDPNCQATQGFGMIGMRERSQRIGAVFTLTSRSGQGTTVQVILPVLIPLQEIQP